MSQSLAENETLLLKQPTLSADQIAFLYAGDIWVIERDDGAQNAAHLPRRLTAQKGAKLNPVFSPDGQWIAFSGNYDGNLSVYVISKDGGSPKRLTYHPDDDLVRGWTPDGQNVLFASARAAITSRVRRLFTIPVEGGFPTALPMQTAERGCFSPDGTRIAYTAYTEAFWSWKRYRGGRTIPIWVLDLATTEHVEIPHENASDTFPCWVGESIFFLSDRCGVMNVFRCDLKSRAVTQVTFHTDFDVRSLTAGAGELIYEQAGRVHLLNPTNGKATPLKISIAADLPETRPHYVPAAAYIQNAGISPTGSRAVFEARGEIFTLPAKKGDGRNLTQTAGICERDPAWSPDGKSMAYFSDASGEYELVISDQKGFEKTFIPLGKRSFFYSPTWSPDGTKIAFTDKALNLYYINLKPAEAQAPAGDQPPAPPVEQPQEIVLVDTDTYDHPERSLNPAWSPDSQWLAYTKRLNSHIRAVFLYELASRQPHQVTDGMSDATDACWSQDGKYLFFAASSNFGLNTGWLDMSSMERPVNRSLYVMVLSKVDPSPLAPESDEEKGPESEKAEGEAKTETKAEEGKPKEAEKKPPVPTVKIDLEKLDQRIQALPMPGRDYRRLRAIEGKLFFLELVPNQPHTFNLHTYDLKERKDEVFLANVRWFWVSADGKKLLYQTAEPQSRYAIVGTDKKPEPKEEDYLKIQALEVPVDPKAEWRQIFREAYRIHRDYFYDAPLHGLDWEATYQKYLPFLEHVDHREDLNYLLAELSGELVVGHAYVGQGDIPAPASVNVGLLGADFEVVDGFYRIQRIYPGLNWHPELRSPLTEPGVNVAEGEYLLAVNGRPLRYPASPYSLFEKTTEQVTDLRISPTPDEAGARTVTVKPVASETALRHWNWVEGNRKKVDALSNGRVAYIYMPDTGVDGYASFNRYYYSQLDKQAVVLDERFNGGGYVADYIVDMLDRPLLSYWATREGKEFTSPNASIFGPKVMIINELAGSGGDAMPLFFRRRGLGKLVGKRTWGGLIGIYDYPTLMDGGFFSSPRLAIYSPDGEWEVENEGIAPDIEVEQTPKQVIAGHDPQLEKAVEVVLAELEAQPSLRKGRPKPAMRAAAG
jgi:tricorn protease